MNERTEWLLRESDEQAKEELQGTDAKHRRITFILTDGENEEVRELNFYKGQGEDPHSDWQKIFFMMNADLMRDRGIGIAYEAAVQNPDTGSFEVREFTA